MKCDRDETEMCLNCGCGEHPKYDATQKPTTTGAWWMRSDETGQEWCPVEIIEQNGILMVDDAMIGVNQLDHYHDNLVGIEWRPDNEPV